MKKTTGAACYWLLLTLQGCATTQAPPVVKPAWQQQIATAALNELENTGTPSLQIAIGAGGRILFQGAWGYADLEHNVAASNKTRYRTASVSKLFTAIATLRLTEAGKLDLDAPIQHYCPTFPTKRWKLTTRQLLTHTSGIRHYVDYATELTRATNASDRQVIEQQRDRNQLATYTRFTGIEPTLEGFKNDPLLFEPGTDWAYSSFGYRVLACVLEGAAGQSYRSVLQSEVFDAAGMADALDDDAWAIIPNRAAGYRLARDKTIRRADMRDVSENLPAGGHLSTATDLVLLAEALQAHTLLPHAAIKWMSQPVMRRAPENDKPSWRDAIPSEGKYGAGLMLFPDQHGLRMGHTGRQAGGSALVALIPDSNLSIAIMTNAKGWNGYISLLGTVQGIIEQAEMLRINHE